MRREDLRVVLPGNEGARARSVTAPVSDAELAELIESMGYVRVPDCEECEGRGIDRPEGCICPYFTDTNNFRIADLGCPVHGVNGVSAQPDDEWDPCPSCGGSGKQRMVPLGGLDADMLAWMCEPSNRIEYPTDWGAATEYVALAVLAALEGDTDE